MKLTKKQQLNIMANLRGLNNCMEMKALQAAFEEMKFELDQYTDGWIISVYEDASDYVNGVTWHVEQGVPPILFMSDQLYDMYCKSVGMKNENVRPGKVAGK
jgi:hypothetical protein